MGRRREGLIGFCGPSHKLKKLFISVWTYLGGVMFLGLSSLLLLVDGRRTRDAIFFIAFFISEEIGLTIRRGLQRYV